MPDTFIINYNGREIERKRRGEGKICETAIGDIIGITQTQYYNIADKKRNAVEIKDAITAVTRRVRFHRPSLTRSRQRSKKRILTFA